MTRWTLRFLLIVLGFDAGGAVAQNQDLEALRKAVVEFARGQAAKLPGEVEIEVGPLDERLQLSACQSLQTYLPAGTRLWGRSNVGVRCQKPESWSMNSACSGVRAARSVSPGAKLRRISSQKVRTFESGTACSRGGCCRR